MYNYGIWTLHEFSICPQVYVIRIYKDYGLVDREYREVTRIMLTTEEAMDMNDLLFEFSAAMCLLADISTRSDYADSP